MMSIDCNGKTYECYNQLEFIDVGGSKGGSYKFIKNKFKFENGLTIDIDIRKVNESLKNNTPAIRLDATHMNIFNDNACKLVSIIHTLEHLPNEEIIKKVLKESCRVASDTVYIKGPMYYQNYLSKKGFQFYWSHWTGHTCLIEPETIIKIMEELGNNTYELNFLNLVENSNDPCIHSINGLINRHAYDKKIDPPKIFDVCFEESIYKEFELIFKV
tara:strand:+ start:5903 stop:6550 length:648 start_codon:yes stop_codon:yes gene_type:complete